MNIGSRPERTDVGGGECVLLDIRAVAARLAVLERFIRRLVSERRIPYLKIGHFIRFDSGDVERWIEQSRQPAAADQRQQLRSVGRPTAEPRRQ
jgi:excisionase family DNA binding protein